MRSINIRAESEVPTVKIEPSDSLDYGKIFLRNPEVIIYTILFSVISFIKY
jgi:hypothetical protein